MCLRCKNNYFHNSLPHLENSQVSSKLVSYMAFWNALVQLPSLQGFISRPPYANLVGCVEPTVDSGSGCNVHYSNIWLLLFSKKSHCLSHILGFTICAIFSVVLSSVEKTFSHDLFDHQAIFSSEPPPPLSTSPQATSTPPLRRRLAYSGGAFTARTHLNSHHPFSPFHPLLLILVQIISLLLPLTQNWFLFPRTISHSSHTSIPFTPCKGKLTRTWDICCWRFRQEWFTEYTGCDDK